MTLEMIVVLAILFVAIGLFISEKVRVDVTALGVVVALMLSGILTTGEALAGFSNSSVVTIAALFVIGGAVLQTGLADLVGRNILQVAGKGERTLPLILMLTSAVMSSFMSDTGTVAVLLPIVIILARNAQVAPSKLLMPMAFGSLLGGAMTLIGTPPNIIVSDVLRENGYETFGFFSYTPLGGLLLMAGVGVMWLFGNRLLPDHKIEKSVTPQTEQLRVVEAYHLQDEMSRLRVRLNSPLIGQTVYQANLRHDYDIDLLKIMRSPKPRPELQILGHARDGKGAQNEPVLVAADTIIELDDVMVVMGDPQKIAQAALHHNLAVQPPKPKDNKALVGREVGVAEVVLPRRSRLVGKTVTEMHFQEIHSLSVLSVFRPNHGQFDDVRDLKLQFGDVLIVHGTWDNLLALKSNSTDYIVLGQPEAMVTEPITQKAAWVAMILVAMIITMVGEWLPLTQTAFVAAGAVVLTGCISMDEAYRAINWKSLVLIAGMIPMSTALSKVGLVDVIATGIVESLGTIGPLAMLAGLFVLTAVFTQFLSNTATVVIVAPIALIAAQNLGVAPHAFLMGIAVAGSMAFASPVASPVNTLIMGPGNYQFGDYLKAGVPLILLSLIASLLILPLLFPF